MSGTTLHCSTKFLAAAAGLLAAFIALPAAAYAAVAIDLMSEATVSGSVVKLSDIATVAGGEADSLAERIVCPSPAEGDTMVISPTIIRRRLLAVSGRADFQLTGAAACRVTRSSASAASESVASSDGGDAGDKSRTLRQVLTELFQSSIGRPSERLKIQFDDRDDELLSARESHYSFRIRTSDSGICIGSNSIAVELYETDNGRRLFRSAALRVRVLLLEDVAVVVRDMKPGEIIKPQDVAMRRAEFSSDDLSRCFRDLRSLIGATVRVPITQGEVIDVGDLTKTLLVRRGQTVTVYVEARGLTVRTISRALGSGELGDVVAVQGKEGRGQFYAEVIGSATVRVRTVGADARAAAASGGGLEIAGRR